MCSKVEPIIIVIPEHEQKAWTHLLHAMKTLMGTEGTMIELARDSSKSNLHPEFIKAWEHDIKEVEKLTDKLIKKTYDHGREF